MGTLLRQQLALLNQSHKSRGSGDTARSPRPKRSLTVTEVHKSQASRHNRTPECVYRKQSKRVLAWLGDAQALCSSFSNNYAASGASSTTELRVRGVWIPLPSGGNWQIILMTPRFILDSFPTPVYNNLLSCQDRSRRLSGFLYGGACERTNLANKLTTIAVAVDAVDALLDLIELSPVVARLFETELKAVRELIAGDDFIALSARVEELIDDFLLVISAHCAGLGAVGENIDGLLITIRSLERARDCIREDKTIYADTPKAA